MVAIRTEEGNMRRRNRRWQMPTRRTAPAALVALMGGLILSNSMFRQESAGGKIRNPADGLHRMYDTLNGINVVKSNKPYETNVMTLIHDHLLNYDPGQNLLVSALATVIEVSADAKKLTFNLRAAETAKAKVTAATTIPSTVQRSAALVRLQRLIAGFNADSPCANAIINLVALSAEDGGDPAFRETLEAARVNMKEPPQGRPRPDYTFYGKRSVDELVDTLATFTAEWCSALPTIQGSEDDGLKYIGQMYWFYYNNEAGVYFVQGRSAKGEHEPLVYDFMSQFRAQYGNFMDSPASTSTIQQWVDDPRTEIQDYEPAADGSYHYRSANEIFRRRFKLDKEGNIPSRPVTMPERDYIISSPTDCIMNPLVQVLKTGTNAVTRKFVENPLQDDTVLDVKGIPISVDKLLGDAPEAIRSTFSGGTGLSCILMPATYHHFHAPVSGSVVYAAIVKGPTFGYNDWIGLMPRNHNPGQPGTDFSQFEVYQRAVVIIQVTYKDSQQHDQTGYVASIPVGLDTVGSVELNKDIIPSPDASRTNYPTVKRGVTEIGYFQYGGSLDLLLFSKGLANGSIQTRLGSQIGIINTH
jgi:phosphatidylserine decarboxylase